MLAWFSPSCTVNLCECIIILLPYYSPSIFEQLIECSPQSDGESMAILIVWDYEWRSAVGVGIEV